MRAFGGAGSSSFNIRRSFSATGYYSTVQTESSITYFNVNGTDANLWWRVCGVNEYGETCSAPFRTRAECGHDDNETPLF
jgi:hypothetical protein